MRSSASDLSPSAAARRLGVSVKALRLYEQRGLLSPGRTPSGWRTYGPADMERARAIVTLRGLGLGLAEIRKALAGAEGGLEPALSAHQEELEIRVRRTVEAMAKLRALRIGLGDGDPVRATEPAAGAVPEWQTAISFDLPWPWGGERFTFSAMRRLNYIIGPLGSGKTRLAKRIAGALPSAAFIGLERLEDGGAAASAKTSADRRLGEEVDKGLRRLAARGGTVSPALIALLTEIQASPKAVLVIDMIEQGLDRASQEALSLCLREGTLTERPLFLMTRSSCILDLAALSAEETVILCPANHSPPVVVSPYPGAPGYEAVSTCLATPEVRARTEGVIAWRPPQPA